MNNSNALWAVAGIAFSIGFVAAICFMLYVMSLSGNREDDIYDEGYMEGYLECYDDIEKNQKIKNCSAGVAGAKNDKTSSINRV